MCGSADLSVFICDSGVERLCEEGLHLFDVHTWHANTGRKLISYRVTAALMLVSAQGQQSASHLLNPFFCWNDVSGQFVIMWRKPADYAKWLRFPVEANLIISRLPASLQGPNALVTYTIVSGADDCFRIDPESGDLIATKKLDRERRSKYSLLVRADDGKQSSDMRLNITVKDVNDHTPEFSRVAYSFDIPEDMAPGEGSAPLSEASDRS